MDLYPVPDLADEADELAAPADLGLSGRALWDELASVFTFSAHELAILHEAARVKDRLDLLAAVIDDEGPTALTHRGETKIHPALSEARAQEITLARLVASLRLPDAEGNVPQRRGSARGTYRDRRAYGAYSTGRR